MKNAEVRITERKPPLRNGAPLRGLRFALTDGAQSEGADFTAAFR